MNSVVDAITKRTPHIVRNLLQKVLGKTVSRVLVAYASPSDPVLDFGAGTGTVVGAAVAVYAWRGVPIENEAPAPDTASQQYILLRADLSGAGITPARGDFITDNAVTYSIDRVENGEIGSDVIYYLLTTTLRAS